MSITLGNITLKKITRIQTKERGGYVRYSVPGMAGESAQDLGRKSADLLINGAIFGTESANELADLRRIYLDRKPVEFLADITGKAYFSEVIVTDFSVQQDSQQPDQYNFLLALSEYVPLPEPEKVLAAGVDLGPLEEAQNFMDQALLSDDLMDLKDPTKGLAGMLGEVKAIFAPLDAEAATINEIYGIS